MFDGKPDVAIRALNALLLGAKKVISVDPDSAAVSSGYRLTYLANESRALSSVTVADCLYFESLINSSTVPSYTVGPFSSSSLQLIMPKVVNTTAISNACFINVNDR